MINGLGVCVVALKADPAPFGGPDAHALGLQLRQLDPAGAVAINIGAFFRHILLLPKKRTGPLDGYAPGFFFDHKYHLNDIIHQLAAKRKMGNY